MKGRRSSIRPYFGWYTKGIGGPKVRVERLAREFGNFKLGPNVLYVNSAGIPSRKEILVLRTLHPWIRVVYNQNGVFYPAWYSAADWREKNATMLAKARGADRVLFQSHFCRRALEAVTGEQVPGEVLYNATPDFGFKRRAPGGRVTLSMTAIFGKDCEHFLAPAIEAIGILSRDLKDGAPRLILMGRIEEDVVFSLPRLAPLRGLLGELKANGLIEVRGAYAESDLARAYSEVDLALHLRDQDACPNAVIERMSLGIGHVYLDSGGTPELVGDSGVKVSAPAGFRFDSFFSPSADDLAQAIRLAMGQLDTLSALARARYEAHFTWDRFVNRHRQAFEEVLSGREEKPYGKPATDEAHL